MLNVRPYTPALQKLAAKFDCGNSYLNQFLRSPDALDAGANTVGVVVVPVVVGTIRLDVPDVVGIVGVRGAEPPVGGGNESYPDTKRLCYRCAS